MKITKISHCNLFFEYDDIRVLLDPGKFNIDFYSKLTDLDYIIIADAHRDHCSEEGIKKLLEKNPGSKIITTISVFKRLSEELPDIKNELSIIEKDRQIKIEKYTWTFGVEPHIPSYKDKIKSEDILWFQIENKYFGSGDTFKKPSGNIDLMGINIIAPFGSMEAFIDYALEVKPKRVFNIHDGYLNKDFTTGFYSFVKNYLEENGISYDFVNDGDVIEF